MKRICFTIKKFQIKEFFKKDNLKCQGYFNEQTNCSSVFTSTHQVSSQSPFFFFIKIEKYKCTEPKKESRLSSIQKCYHESPGNLPSELPLIHCLAPDL